LALTSAGAKTWAVSAAKLTVAETPGIEFNERSTELTQALQVIPVTLKVLGSRATLLSVSAISTYSIFNSTINSTI
jgi:hypothetical protein